MARGALSIPLTLLVLAVVLSGCRFDFETRERWRAEAEDECIAARGVVASAFMEPLPAIDGPGMCGMDHPFRVSALSGGNVVLEPAGKLACPVIYQVDAWVNEVVQPAAMAWLGQPIVAISQMSAYSCRGMNGQAGAKISEHAFGNALDIGAFRTADGRWITVRDGWKGPADARGFLLQVQAGACERFSTVLAPGSNMFHYDHIHLDLMRHAKGRTICKPAPRPMPAPMATKAPPMAQQPQLEAAPQAVMAPPEPLPPPPAEAPPSFLSGLFAPRPAPAAAEPPPPPPPVQWGAPPASSSAIVTSPAPLPPAAMPQSAPAARPAPPPPAPSGVPPGWQVGPQGVPMSYTSPGASAGNPETGSIKRKYYTAPLPQPSTIPLPKAKAGED